MAPANDDIGALARRNPWKRLRQARCGMQHPISCLDRTTLASANTEERHEALDDCPMPAGRMRKCACNDGGLATRSWKHSNADLAGSGA
jgi:hypothetical protein